MVKVTDFPVPPFASDILVTFRWFYPPACHHALSGHQFHGYYGFICNPLAPRFPSLVRLAELMAQFHSLHANGSSPGKNVISFTPRLPSLHRQVTERILDFGVCGHLIPCPCLTKVHFRLVGSFDSGFLQIPHWALIHHSPGLSG